VKEREFKKEVALVVGQFEFLNLAGRGMAAFRWSPEKADAKPVISKAADESDG
jgi:hypothetical protein